MPYALTREYEGDKVLGAQRMIPLSTGGFREDAMPRQESSSELEAGAVRRHLGLPKENAYLEKALAPPVDRELLKAFAEKKLPPEEDDLVAERIASFPSWEDGYREILVEESGKAARINLNGLLGAERGEE